MTAPMHGRDPLWCAHCHCGVRTGLSYTRCGVMCSAGLRCVAAFGGLSKFEQFKELKAGGCDCLWHAHALLPDCGTSCHAD
jgi:hypothetical protein